MSKSSIALTITACTLTYGAHAQTGSNSTTALCLAGSPNGDIVCDAHNTVMGTEKYANVVNLRDASGEKYEAYFYHEGFQDYIQVYYTTADCAKTNKKAQPYIESGWIGPDNRINSYEPPHVFFDGSTQTYWAAKRDTATVITINSGSWGQGASQVCEALGGGGLVLSPAVQLDIPHFTTPYTTK